MAGSKPSQASGAAGASAGASSAPKPKVPAGNPALRMLGLPRLPKKLPSRNWMIFFTITGAFSAAIIYDKREKKRATARWSRAVSHLAKEPVSNPSEMPRKLTIYLESPPREGLRAAQDHFTEYVKPVLAASGLDWEFVQGRQQGDVRAAVAEKIRRERRRSEEPTPPPSDPSELTDEELIKFVQERNGTPQWTGMRGDIVIGRHTWKEYIRGLHEGWLGPLTQPPQPVPEIIKSEQTTPEGESDKDETAEGAEGEKKEEKKPEEKPKRPPQIPPYNTTEDYSISSLPLTIPTEFSPSAPIPFPHLLGFTGTFIRMYRFLNRRHLADQIGREVAAVCLANAREYRENVDGPEAEQQVVLEKEEKDWPKDVWKDEKPKEGEATPAVPKEKIWASPIVLDSRLGPRMRRFEATSEDEARAKNFEIPEEELEGWIKGSLRSLYRWAVTPTPKAYYSDDDDD